MKPAKTTAATKPANAKAGADDEGEDTPQIRALRIAVAVMSLLLVVGFITVIARIIYLTSRPNAPNAATATATTGAALKPEAVLGLPAGGSIKSMSLSGNRLAVHYVSPLGDGIAILDLEQGRVLSRVSITEAGKP